MLEDAGKVAAGQILGLWLQVMSRATAELRRRTAARRREPEAARPAY